MNIFILDYDPYKAAQAHCDKHLVKMILESFQMLCTAHRVLDGTLINKKYVHPTLNDVLYKATHINHPCSVWCRYSIVNYMWLVYLTTALCDEYTHRYGKVHLSYTKLYKHVAISPINISQQSMTSFAQAMPDQYRHSDAVTAYRNYYIHEKKKFATYTKREMPIWLLGENTDAHI